MTASAAPRRRPTFAPGPIVDPRAVAPDGEPLVFVVPMPANQANRASGRSHWRVRDAERKAYHATLDTLRTLRCLPPPPAVPMAQAHVRSAMVLGGAMDDDNAVARHKPLLDWLVRRGYVASDRRTCLRWAAFPEQRVSHREAAAITLVLAPGWP